MTRLGIIGAAGRTGRQIAAVLGRCEHATLAGVADLDREACRVLAKQHDAKYFGSHGRLLASSDIDGVVLCVPPARRPRLTDLAVDAGKPFLVPLPIATQASEARAMARRAEEAGVAAGAAAGLRFLPHWVRTKEALEQGRLGRVRSILALATGGVDGTWADRGGGVLMGQTHHILDALVWLLGLPQRVAALAWPPAEVDAAAAAALDYRDGCQGAVHCRPPAWDGEDRVEIWGDAGRLTVGQAAVLEVYGEAEPLVLAPAAADGVETGLIACLDDFAQALTDTRPTAVPLGDAAQGLELVNAITLSAHSLSAVDVPLDGPAYAGLLRTLRRQERRP